ncbi:MAG TPA: ABC transporter ATP-binding protein [Phycisphaerae bacterium]|nr:ABC transporter ATP-binding protein [Phycisphaerae bacterium]
MSASAIRIAAVSKRFRRGERVDSIRDWAARWLSPRRRESLLRADEFWALRQISLEVAAGEAFGIIGPNGAGKSTMLKLLAGIMRPTEGTIHVGGRVSALIELGAGFHSDLTGRENIYLNASILGIGRREVRRKFAEIEAFADIGDFLDTPLKRYSSGMHARLGFAIAAHTDPDILLVDEVLSVGDRVFRTKCLDKMRDFLKKGAAVVFVSHDLGTVNRFCHRAMVLDRGRQLFCGAAGQAVALYYDACSQSLINHDARGAATVQISNVRVTTLTGRPVTTAESGQRVRFTFDVEFAVAMKCPSFGLSLIRTEDHSTLYESSSTRQGWSCDPVEPGDRARVSYDIALNVGAGQYALGLHVRDRDDLEYAVQLVHASYVLVDSRTSFGGVVHLDPSFTVSTISPASLADPVLV